MQVKLRKNGGFNVRKIDLIPGAVYKREGGSAYYLVLEHGQGIVNLITNILITEENISDDVLFYKVWAIVDIIEE